MIVRIAAGALCAFGVAACATAEQIPVRGETPGFVCNDRNIEQFAGRQATAELGAQMLRTSGARTLRWVPHGTVITMEFRADRLTVYLDPSNRIERVNCG